MFSSRAKRFKRDGDRHWAMAKAGLGAYHYGKAKFCYDQSKANQLKAAQAAASGAREGQSHRRTREIPVIIPPAFSCANRRSRSNSADTARIPWRARPNGDSRPFS